MHHKIDEIPKLVCAKFQIIWPVQIGIKSAKIVDFVWNLDSNVFFSIIYFSKTHFPAIKLYKTEF